MVISSIEYVDRKKKTPHFLSRFTATPSISIIIQTRKFTQFFVTNTDRKYNLYQRKSLVGKLVKLCALNFRAKKVWTVDDGKYVYDENDSLVMVLNRLSSLFFFYIVMPISKEIIPLVYVPPAFPFFVVVYMDII